MTQVHQRLAQVESKYILEFTHRPHLRVELLGVDLYLARLDKHGYLHVLVLGWLLDVLNKALLVLHELGLVVTFGDLQARTGLDIVIFEDEHYAIALHCCVLVLGASDVRLVGYDGDLLDLDLLEVPEGVEVVFGTPLVFGQVLLLVILDLEFTHLVGLHLEVVVHLLEGTLLELGHNVFLQQQVGLHQRQSAHVYRKVLVQVLGNGVQLRK